MKNEECKMVSPLVMPVPEVFYFGRKDSMGHSLHYKRQARRYDETPWGIHLDGGLLKTKMDVPDGDIVYAQKDGWTAIAFWDRSGDSRPGSNSAFLTPALVDLDELIRRAREQWPEVFRRQGFPVRYDPA